MNNVLEDMEKVRKEIHNATGIQEHYLYGPLEMFIVMDIDVKKHGEHLHGNCHRIKV